MNNCCFEVKFGVKVRLDTKFRPQKNFGHMTSFSADMQKFLQIRQNPQNPKNHKMEGRDRMKLANFKKKFLEKDLLGV